MLREAKIENFRGIEKIEAELDRVAVLLGPNSSGKSSVLHAIRFACSALAWTLRQGPEPKVRDQWIAVWEDWPIRADEAFLPAVPTEDLFLNRAGHDLIVTLRFDDADFVQELRVMLRYGRNAALKLDVRVKSAQALAAASGIATKSRQSPVYSQRLAEALVGKEPIAVAVPSFYGVVRHEPYVNDARLERLLGAGEQGAVVRNLVARLDTLKELSDLLRMSVGAEIAKSTSGQDLQQAEDLAVQFRDKNGELEISAAGTGLVALTALFSSLKWYQPRAAQGRPLLFLLDEPEAHLHPKLQAATGDRLADLITNFGAQVILATHSVEMINRLGRRADTVLLSVDRTVIPAAVRLTSEDEIVERLEAFCDLSPFASLQLLRSRRVLFHEGKTDRSILEDCARAYFANDPTRLAQFRRWTFVELSSETNAEAKNVLKRALAPLAAVGAAGDPVRIVRVLDRDYHRQPVFGPEQGDVTLKEFDIVWSRYSIESLFLEAPCLAAWIRLALAAIPAAPSAIDLEKWIADGIASANSDSAMLDAATAQMIANELRKVPQISGANNKPVIDAIERAKSALLPAPEVYQRGKDRAHHILMHLRGKLPVSMQNKVRSDLAEVLKHAPSPSTLIAPALVPPEIEQLLKYLTS